MLLAGPISHTSTQDIDLVNLLYFTGFEEETIDQTTTLSKCELLGAVTAFGAVGFRFGIGAILADKTVHSLEYCIEELISRK